MRQYMLAILICAVVLSSCSAPGTSEAPTPAVAPATPRATARPAAAPTRVPPTVVPTRPPRTVAPTAASPTGTAAEGKSDIERQVEQIEADTAALRGLQPKADVPERFLSPQQLRANLKQQIDAEYSSEEARRDALELWLLRLIDDRAVDLYQLQLDLLSEQVLGYYDPKTDEFFVLGDQQQLTPLARETVSHEFVHSLQDQYYDLEKLRPEHLNDDDRSRAITALIEGDATVAGLQYARQHMSPTELATLLRESSAASTEVLDRAPPYIRESLIFPYQQGAQFILTLLGRGAPGAIDAALADPPRSTEQILHPEKYLTTSRDAPLPVTPAALTETLGVGWSYRDSDTLGEFDLGILLRENGLKETSAAVGGWGGARYALYQNGEQALIILATRWDSAKDSAEFAEALEQSLVGARQVGQLSADGQRFFGLARAGDQVVYIASTDEMAAQRALAAVK